MWLVYLGHDGCSFGAISNVYRGQQHELLDSAIEIVNA